ncbi:MAG: thioredoxin family protein [Lysobacterales bacterium]
MNVISDFLLIATTIVAFLIAPNAGANEPETTDQLQPLASWTITAAEAKRRNVPIVILFEQRNCGFCQRLKKELFRPTANNPEYSRRAIFVSVLTDYDADLLEHGNTQISGFEFAEQFKALTTPTVLFIDSTGKTVEKRIVGYVSGDQYNQSFKRKLEASIAAVSTVGV